jgi:hypothetical protein
MFRRKKTELDQDDGVRPVVYAPEVIASQRFAMAVRVAAAVSVFTVVFWIVASDMLGRVFPWFVMLQGLAIGFAVRRWGHGFDWRFPTLAAGSALASAYMGNFLVAAHASAEELATSVLNVVFSITFWTLEVYFAEVVTPPDHIFALFSAALAAYYCTRKLNRYEIHALRTSGSSGTPE